MAVNGTFEIPAIDQLVAQIGIYRSLETGVCRNQGTFQRTQQSNPPELSPHSFYERTGASSRARRGGSTRPSNGSVLDAVMETSIP